MTIGLVVAAAMIGTAAWLGEKNALWIPGVVLVFAAGADLLLT